MSETAHEPTWMADDTPPDMASWRRTVAPCCSARCPRGRRGQGRGPTVRLKGGYFAACQFSDGQGSPEWAGVSIMNDARKAVPGRAA